MKITNDDKKIQLNYIDGDDIYIFGEFDDTISSNVISNFHTLIYDLKNKKDAEINIYIDSPGGYTDKLLELLTCVSQAKSYGIKINTIVMGRAASCASMLAVVGDYRSMYKYSHNLMHLGEIVLSVQTSKQLNRLNKLTTDFHKMIKDIYLKNTKLKEKELDEILSDDDYYLDAEECLKKGLCDNIID